MAIVLEDHAHTAKLVKAGHDAAIEVSAGMHLRVETSPGGEDVLDAECPAGKAWVAKVTVEIIETDA